MKDFLCQRATGCRYIYGVHRDGHGCGREPIQRQRQSLIGWFGLHSAKGNRAQTYAQSTDADRSVPALSISNCTTCCDLGRESLIKLETKDLIYFIFGSNFHVVPTIRTILDPLAEYQAIYIVRLAAYDNVASTLH